jgi:hypothetical protein
VEKFEHEHAWIELGEWRNSRMPKVAISFTCHAGKIGLGNSIADKWAKHLDRNFSVGLAGEAFDRCAIERWPTLGDIESTVAREAREHHIDKVERGSLAPS